MIWKFANKLNNIFPFLILLIVFLNNQLLVDISRNCSNEPGKENKILCANNLEIISEIIKTFRQFTLGHVTAISQPPLIISPKVNIEAPTSLKSVDELKEPIISKRPLKPKIKVNEKIKIIDVVKVLDEKGSMHLNRCLRKLNNKTRERYFAGLGKELETLDSLAKFSKNEKNPFKKLFKQSPSQKDCINYLDFILLAG